MTTAEGKREADKTIPPLSRNASSESTYQQISIWLIKSHSDNASDQWIFSSQDVRISLSLEYPNFCNFDLRDPIYQFSSLVQP
jgi:hypothetical protein